MGASRDSQCPYLRYLCTCLAKLCAVGAFQLFGMADSDRGLPNRVCVLVLYRNTREYSRLDGGSRFARLLHISMSSAMVYQSVSRALSGCQSTSKADIASGRVHTHVILHSGGTLVQALVHLSRTRQGLRAVAARSSLEALANFPATTDGPGCSIMPPARGEPSGRSSASTGRMARSSCNVLA